MGGIRKGKTGNGIEVERQKNKNFGGEYNNSRIEK